MDYVLIVWNIVNFMTMKKMNNMREYNVEVCETLIRIVTIEAMNAEDAIKFVRYDYNNAELVLDSDDFFDVEFEIVNRD